MPLAVSGVCVIGKSVWVRETSVAVEEVWKPAEWEPRRSCASCGVSSSLRCAAMARRASTDAGCPRAKAGGVECVVQWYGVNEVHESESKKVMKAEGGSGREIESTGGGLWC